jgi:protein-L-isoaspartate(D-aspartate) O-methyltransferase
MSDQVTRRARMVSEQIAGRGIRDGDVLDAMRSVPRQFFVPEGLEDRAYLDTPLSIGYGQTISQPYMVALMTELLQVNVRSRVLEVGAGSGYQTAVLAELAGEVFALERLAPLAEQARAVLARLHYKNVHLAIGDGTQGWSEAAPFDGILVAAAVEKTPPLLLEQLADGGRLVIPLGRPHLEQTLTVYERRGDEFVRHPGVACRFVPLVSDADGEGGDEGPVAREWGLFAGAEGSRPGEGAAMKAVQARVYGRVQGVYYRATARAEGARLGLRGWVKNVADGSVALHLQGEPAVVDAMLDWCSVGPPAARVQRVEVVDAAPDDGLRGFEVR